MPGAPWLLAGVNNCSGSWFLINFNLENRRTKICKMSTSERTRPVRSDF